GRLLAVRLEEVVEVVLDEEVHARRGLVEEDELGSAHQRSRQKGALQLAAREARELPVGERGGAHPVESRETLLALGATDAGRPRAAQARGHELERRRRERAVERLELRDVADALGVRAGAVAEERGVPGQRPHQPERDLEEGRLPAAVGPDDREEPAPRQVERDVLEHGRLREAHGDAVEVQRGQVARRPRVAAVAAPAGARSRRGLLRRSRLRTGSHSGDANSRERPPEATRRTLRQGWRARGTAGEPPPPAPAQRWLGLL